MRGEAERAAKEALKNAVSDISHQLKTPLAALSMYMEILKEEPERPETVREFSAKALQSLERMQRLIGLLLKIMRLDAGSVRFEPEDCPVSELVREAVEELTTRARQEGKRLIVEGDPKERVRCDPAWTAEALSNGEKRAGPHGKRRNGVHPLEPFSGAFPPVGGGRRLWNPRRICPISSNASTAAAGTERPAACRGWALGFRLRRRWWRDRAACCP